MGSWCLLARVRKELYGSLFVLTMQFGLSEETYLYFSCLFYLLLASRHYILVCYTQSVQF
jgi:hypothetical protein